MPFDGLQGPSGDIERLLDARSRIAHPHHWIKRTFKDGDRYCMVGALSMACGSLNVDSATETERRLVRVLAAQLPKRRRLLSRIRLRSARRDLMAYNDNPNTRHSDVLALFDKTIAHLQVQQLALVA
jgi:hypothetical protein